MLKSDDFSDRTLTPLSGAPLTLRLNAGASDTVGGATITDVDFFGSNGVIHVVDRVIP